MKLHPSPQDTVQTIGTLLEPYPALYGPVMDLLVRHKDPRQALQFLLGAVAAQSGLHRPLEACVNLLTQIVSRMDAQFNYLRLANIVHNLGRPMPHPNISPGTPTGKWTLKQLGELVEHVNYALRVGPL